MDTEMFQWHQFINQPNRLSCAFQSITVVFGFGLANITAPLLEIKCFIITFVFQYHQTIMKRISAFASTWSRWNKAATLHDRGAVIKMSGVVKIFFKCKKGVCVNAGWDFWDYRTAADKGETKKYLLYATCSSSEQWNFTNMVALLLPSFCFNFYFDGRLKTIYVPF